MTKRQRLHSLEERIGQLMSHYSRPIEPEAYHKEPFADYQGGWENLTCPKCGAEDVVGPEESKLFPSLGDRMQCWICKYKFVITGNCWKPRKTYDEIFAGGKPGT
jgi:hypothetical protein